MSTKSKGLGDTVAKITKATGIDKLVHKVVGEDCGCEDRQEALNKMVPYGPYLCAEDAETFRDEILPKARSGTLDKATSMQFINIFTSSIVQFVQIVRHLFSIVPQPFEKPAGCGPVLCNPLVFDVCLLGHQHHHTHQYAHRDDGQDV